MLPHFHISKPICISFWMPLNLGFPGGSVAKNPPANSGDTALTSRWGRSPAEGNSHPHQYSCLGNPTDRGAWWAIVHGVTNIWTWLSNWARTPLNLCPKSTSGNEAVKQIFTGKVWKATDLDSFFGRMIWVFKKQQKMNPWSSAQFWFSEAGVTV